MMLVLSSVAGKCFELAVVSSDWDLESNDIITCHDVLEHLRLDSSFGGSVINHLLDIFQELWFDLFVHWIRNDICSVSELLAHFFLLLTAYGEVVDLIHAGEWSQRSHSLHAHSLEDRLLLHHCFDKHLFFVLLI